MRALIYYVATTLDGFIAHPDGRFDGFVPEGDHIDAFFGALSDFGAVLMGRRTYAVGLAEGVTSPYPMIPEQLVFSTTMQRAPDPAIELVRGDAIGRVKQLKASPGKPIWLCGGSVLAGALWQAGLIDRIVVKQNPVLFGAGLPLFAGADAPDRPRTRPLTLEHLRRFDSGVVQLHYRVG